MGTLVEVKKQWTLDDVLDAHELLDLREQMEARAAAAAASRGRR